MTKYEYAIPESAAEIFEYLGENNALIKAGGIDLLDLMKEDLLTPGRLVNIRHLTELKYIKRDKDGNLNLGPNLTLAEIAEDKTVAGQYPVLALAAEEAATPQIRNVATLGGNICQRPRCWYFRSIDFHCSRKGGDTCFALDGENQYHAIFANSGGCAIVHPSAAATALMALDAELTIKHAKGERAVKLADFFVLPEKDIRHENILKTGELIANIRIPSEFTAYKNLYFKQKEKQAFDWPVAEVAVAMKLRDDLVEDARVVLGAAAPVPWRSVAAEKVLNGKKISKNVARDAAEAALSEAEPLSQNGYKVPMFKTVIFRTLCRAAGLDPMM